MPSVKAEKGVISYMLDGMGKGMKSIGTMGVLGFAADTAYNLSNGDDVGKAVVKAGALNALFASNPAIMGTAMLGQAAVEGYWGLQKFNYTKKQWWQAQYGTNNQLGGNYMDTQRAMTMRQAAVQSIQGSKLNARSALGGEAKILNPYSQRR